MNKFIFFLVIFYSVAICKAQDDVIVKASDMIPQPLYCKDIPGSFELHNEQIIFAPHKFVSTAKLLAELLQNRSKVSEDKNRAVIFFRQNSVNENLGKEGYKLTISSHKIIVTSETIEGAIHAIFSIAQLQLMQPDKRKIPCVEIVDSPRFEYRGMHLDVSRNFFPISFIKKYIDLMALYKYNTFHWHLTDGPGWRLEIKKYPSLTKIAAFRTHQAFTEWWKTGRRYSHEGDPNAYGGYYTQEEAKEVVDYAARRGITVIPEIEMPGHSEEVLAVYPELSCSGEPYKNAEFCIGNPGTYTFLENVLTEVMSIFPSKYIHVGGDEANTKPWSQCEKCQKLKKENGLKDEHELQVFLIKHIEKFLEAHGRKLLGWDEIVDGGLPADATVMSWRGMSGGIKAIQQGHDVVMTPGETYLDAYQSDPTTQPEAIGGFLPINRVYNFEPVPNELTANQRTHLLGTQANLWSEYMPTTYQVEYMAWPRAMALAEVGWSKKEYRDFDDFQRRLQQHYLLLQRLNANYYRPSTFLTVTAMPDYEKKMDRIIFLSEQYHPEIRYTIDGTNPSPLSALYSAPFYTSGKTEIKAAIFKNGEQVGDVTSYTADYHIAIGKKVTFNTQWSSAYPVQKEKTLTDGARGSLTYGDKQWLGYLNDFDVTIDMDTVQSISSVAIKFMHQPGPGVYFPAYVELQLSNDGKNFTTIQKIKHDFNPKDKRLAFKNFEFDCKNQTARYIRLIAPNNMGGFMFVDEVVVY